MKTCTSCKENLSLDMFGNQNLGKLGKRSTCKKCHKKSNDKYNRTRDGVITRIYMIQKRSSKKRNHPMPSYSKAWLRAWLYSNGFRKIYNDWVESGYNRMKSVSVDRKMESEPYTIDNIQLGTWRDNVENHNTAMVDGESVATSKAVHQLDLDGNIINTFYSCADASRQTGANKSGICNACKGNTETSHKFKWRYV